MRVLVFTFLFSVCLLASCEGEEYEYASYEAEVLCTQDSCPGEDCLCILGSNNAWYINPTIGDLDEEDKGGSIDGKINRR